MLKNASLATVTQESIVIDNSGYSPCPSKLCWTWDSAASTCNLRSSQECWSLVCDTEKISLTFKNDLFKGLEYELIFSIELAMITIK